MSSRLELDIEKFTKTKEKESRLETSLEKAKQAEEELKKKIINQIWINSAKTVKGNVSDSRNAVQAISNVFSKLTVVHVAPIQTEEEATYYQKEEIVSSFAASRKARFTYYEVLRIAMKTPKSVHNVECDPVTLVFSIVKTLGIDEDYQIGCMSLDYATYKNIFPLSVSRFDFRGEGVPTTFDLILDDEFRILQSLDKVSPTIDIYVRCIEGVPQEPEKDLVVDQPFLNMDHVLYFMEKALLLKEDDIKALTEFQIHSLFDQFCVMLKIYARGILDVISKDTPKELDTAFVPAKDIEQYWKAPQYTENILGTNRRRQRQEEQEEESSQKSQKTDE